MRFMLTRLALPPIACVLFSCAMVSPDEISDEPAGVPRFAEVHRGLLGVMLSGIEMTEPNASFVRRSGKPSLFGGSYDWHSCVIAHWCHLTAVRMQGLDEAIADDLERLSPGALAAEFEHLRQRSTPESLPACPILGYRGVGWGIGVGG